MARGLSPGEAITGAVAADAGRGLRQIQAVDRHGRTAVWTGENCVMWCGSCAEGPVSVAGNVLTTTEDFPDLSLRVDDHTEPLLELRRVLGIWRRGRAPVLSELPRKSDPAGQIDLDAIEAPWIAAGTDLRLRRP